MKLRAHLTEVGTLEVWADSKISDHHWRLQFELRKTAAATSGKPAAVVSEDALVQAEGLLDATFKGGTWARGTSGQARANPGARPEFVATERDSALVGPHAGTGRGPPQIAGA